MKVENKIALKGQAYVAPRAKSFMITNQGVLCASGGGGGRSSFGLTVGKGGLN